MTESGLFNFSTPAGKVYSFDLPASWDDVTLEQMERILKLSKEGDITDIAQWISVFTNIPVEAVNNFSTKSVAENIAPILSFVYSETPDWQKAADTRPDSHVMIGGKVYSTDFKPENMIYGRNIAYEQICKGGKIPTERIAECIALCLDDSEWTANKDAVNADLVKAINKLPYSTALQLHSFFLYRFLSSATRKQPTIDSPHLKKLARVLKGSKSTGHWLRSIISRLGIKRKTATT